MEIVEPVGKRVLIRKDQARTITKSGIHLPKDIKIPTLTGRVLGISKELAIDSSNSVAEYDKVLFDPRDSIPVEFEGENRNYVVPIERVVAILRKGKQEDSDDG